MCNIFVSTSMHHLTNDCCEGETQFVYADFDTIFKLMCLFQKEHKYVYLTSMTLKQSFSMNHFVFE